jgi:membrane protein required for colicin V production
VLTPYKPIDLKITLLMIDIVFAILMVMAAIKGYQKGLIVAVFSVLAYIVGLAAALKLSVVVAGYLDAGTNINSKWLPIISFAIVFFAVVIVVNLLAKWVQKTFEMAYLGWVNRILGVAIYALLYSIIYSVVLFYTEKINVLAPETIKSSVVLPWIKPIGPAVIDSLGKVIPLFKDMFEELTQFFEKLAGPEK